MTNRPLACPACGPFDDDRVELERQDREPQIHDGRGSRLHTRRPFEGCVPESFGPHNLRADGDIRDEKAAVGPGKGGKPHTYDDDLDTIDPSARLSISDAAGDRSGLCVEGRSTEQDYQESKAAPITTAHRTAHYCRVHPESSARVRPQNHRSWARFP